MPGFLADDWGDVYEIKNTHVDLAVLRSLANDDLGIFLTEPGDTWTRLINISKIQKGKIHPTTEGGFYYDQLFPKQSTFKQLFGYFSGDSGDWLGVLIRDGFLDPNDDIYEVTFEVPPGTPYIRGHRPAVIEFGTEIDEIFLVYDRDVKILEKTKISDDDINEAEENTCPTDDWNDD